MGIWNSWSRITKLLLALLVVHAVATAIYLANSNQDVALCAIYFASVDVALLALFCQHWRADRAFRGTVSFLGRAAS